MQGLIGVMSLIKAVIILLMMTLITVDTNSNTLLIKRLAAKSANKDSSSKRSKKNLKKAKSKAKKGRKKSKIKAKKGRKKSKIKAKKGRKSSKIKAKKGRKSSKIKAKKGRKKSTQRVKQSKKRKKARKERKRKRQYYRVVKGESWSGIAKLLKVKVRSLKRWNRRYKRRKRPPAGARLAFYGFSRNTESVGRPNRGSLKHGVHIDPDGDGLGKGYAVSMHRPDLWGTPELVQLVKQCGAYYRRYFSRKYAPIPIGDLSSRKGGRLKSHKSHQSGRDVDVGFMRKKPLSKGYFKNTSPRQMNMYAQWVVLKCFLDSPQTQMIFIERSLVRALKKYVKRIYKKRKKKLTKYLSFFPGGKNKAIYPDKVHKSHMHVRIACPKGDRRCLR